MSTDSLTLPADAPSTTDVSEFSEAEGSENSEVPDVQTQLRALRRELEHEKHRNTQLTAQLKRQTQLQGRLVSLRGVSAAASNSSCHHVHYVPWAPNTSSATFPARDR